MDEVRQKTLVDFVTWCVLAARRGVAWHLESPAERGS
jgi:hypothetical protein